MSRSVLNSCLILSKSKVVLSSPLRFMSLNDMVMLVLMCTCICERQVKALKKFGTINTPTSGKAFIAEC